jgi:asparagine synthase (glutamine-hydrolysing)
MGAWFRSELGTMFEDEVLAGDARSRALLEHGPVEPMYREHRRGLGDHGARLWTLLVLERWLRALERPLDREPPRTPEVTDAEAAVAA